MYLKGKELHIIANDSTILKFIEDYFDVNEHAGKKFKLSNMFEGTEITLSITNNSFVGKSGVNNYSIPFEIKDNKLIISKKGISTLMAGPEEDMKIKTVAYNLDKLFCLLQLQRAHESNGFNQMTYAINEQIRNKSADAIAEVFEKAILKILGDRYSNTTITSVYNYGYFRETGIDCGKRFIRYFFARVELFIAQNTKTGMRYNLYDLVVNTGSTNGFHIEHILADNDTNRKLFNNDPDRFQSERNRLGGLLLLKGKDNISSNNEEYSDKLKSYANTLLWNETLRQDSYKSHLDFSKWISDTGLNFRPMDTFGPDELEERQKLLFEIVKYIWH